MSQLSIQTAEFDHILNRELQHSMTDLDGYAPLLAHMARFHLGWIEPDGTETTTELRTSVQGKRMRPYLAFLSAIAVEGNPNHIGPIAAAIELLHNFTLIHDDIQDRSPNRRHRATVWRIWGDAQAINAGDAMFAAAQRAMLRSDLTRIPPETLVTMLDAFNAMTIDIVRGQTLDIEFERSTTVTSADYLTMIGGKTAAIVRFAAWAGARAAGAPLADAELLGDVGEALGIGFQIRDDVLGIWGESTVTGKDKADDIRRRKKSLPILMLSERASSEELASLNAMYTGETVEEASVNEVLNLLDRHDIQRQANAEVARYHRAATAALDRLSVTTSPAARATLDELVLQLDARAY